MAITWNAATMATGVTQVDQQHQMLFLKLDSLLAALRQGRAKEEIEQMLSWLGQYAAQHFANEEACMNKHRCPVAAANKAAHGEFVRVFGDFQARFHRDGATTSLVLEVEKSLAAWVAQHIQRIDVQLGPCVKKTAGAL